jgi:hypothetical protein
MPKKPKNAQGKAVADPQHSREESSKANWPRMTGAPHPPYRAPDPWPGRENYCTVTCKLAV